MTDAPLSMRAEPCNPEPVKAGRELGGDPELDEELLELCDKEPYLIVMSTAQRFFAFGLLP